MQSHHRPREGPFELNDAFAIINAVPAISLLSYGFFNKGLLPCLSFGAVSPSLLPPVRSPCHHQFFTIDLMLCTIHIYAGTWNNRVWDGLHACPRRTCAPSISCRTHRPPPLSTKSGFRAPSNQLINNRLLIKTTQCSFWKSDFFFAAWINAASSLTQIWWSSVWPVLGTHGDQSLAYFH